MKRLISIVIPIFNEERNISLLYRKLAEIGRKLQDKYDLEIILVNDGSTDKTSLEIEKLTKLNSKVKFIELSRNFGKEIATTAGINNCGGDACILLDADLQHPVELIPEFLAKWEEGAESVIGVREKRGKEGLFKKTGAALFYKLINKMAKINIIPNATDFRLIDRSMIDEFNKFSEKNRMTRALIDWLGFKRDYVYFRPGSAATARPVTVFGNYCISRKFCSIVSVYFP